MKQPSAVANIRRRTRKELYIGLGLYGLSLVAVLILTFLSVGEIPKIKILQQEAASVKSSHDSQIALETYLNDHQQELNRIEAFIPSKNELILFVQDMENLSKSYDPKARVRFSSETPKRIGSSLALPLQIHLNISTIDFLDFLKEFERMPYILEVQTLDIANMNNLEALSSIELGVLLYVQDPFN